MFAHDFDRYVVIHDRISCEVDGFTVHATLYNDEDTEPEKDSPAYESWVKDDWHYFGVVLSVWRDGVQLTEEFAHALWGIEGNCPVGDNSYFREVANEGLADAIADAKDRIHKWAKELNYA